MNPALLLVVALKPNELGWFVVDEVLPEVEPNPKLFVAAGVAWDVGCVELAPKPVNGVDAVVLGAEIKKLVLELVEGVDELLLPPNDG